MQQNNLSILQQLNHLERQLYQELYDLVAFGLNTGGIDRFNELLDANYTKRGQIDIVKVLTTVEEPPSVLYPID